MSSGQREASPPGRRGRPRERLDAAELRQGAVPRQLPARPDPPAADADQAAVDKRRGVPRRAAHVPREQGRPAVRSSATPKIPDDVVEGLKALGAFGMKIPTEYGGLGLSQVYYNKALAMTGVWHAALSTLLSAHQSIGLPQPLMLFGSDEQKKEWLPKLARTHISAFLLTEPDVGSDPARLSVTATPSEDGITVHDQRHQAVGDERRGRRRRHRHGDGAEERGASRRHHRVHRADATPRASTVTHRNAFMGLRGHRELRHDVFDNVEIPAANVVGKEGIGLKIALTTLNTGRLVAAGDLRERHEVLPEDRARVGQRADPVGHPGRPARRGRAEDRDDRRYGVRARGDARRLQPAGRREAQRHPDRSRARQALRLRDGAGSRSTRWCRSAAGGATRPPSR